MIVRAVLVGCVLGAAALTGCGGAAAEQTGPSEPAPGRRCYDIGVGEAAAAPLRGQPRRLDPELQQLVSHHRAETANVIVEFRGELSDLEAIGFVKQSLVAHPTKGYKIATGAIPIDALEALSDIDHVVVISAPQPLGPL